MILTHSHKFSQKDTIKDLKLQTNTPQAWVDCVMTHFDTFLLDHAACEKKAAGMAISMISHYPDREQLVSAMADLAVEEMSHFREVIRLIQKRGMTLTKDEKDPYIGQLRQYVSSGTDAYFLDRLLMGAIVEARGAERFTLLANALAIPNSNADNTSLRLFYTAIAKSESRHYMLFLELAALYFETAAIQNRLEQWISFESKIMLNLAIRPALH